MVLNRSLLRMKRARVLNEMRSLLEPDIPEPGSRSPFSSRPRLEADTLLEQPDFELYELDKENPSTVGHSEASGTKSPWYTVKW
ncbi:hypothetical protein DXG03_003904 [Asterophora parasitica]|uniref:Uncharacterized protein n=1 Tax=Asterophora parasitica TaxID=117018 RepID=A0A9P7G948_9AGAR|nr:hypothetical protein DXG03_003904 [Asterophora parasitica]